MTFYATQPLGQPMYQPANQPPTYSDPARRISDLENSVEHLSSHIKHLESIIQNCVKNDKRTSDSIQRLEIGQKTSYSLYAHARRLLPLIGCFNSQEALDNYWNY